MSNSSTIIFLFYDQDQRLQSVHMRGSRKFCQRGSNTDQVFFLVDGMERMESGLTSVSQQNAIEMAFRWRADNGPPMNAGLVAL